MSADLYAAFVSDQKSSQAQPSTGQEREKEWPNNVCGEAGSAGETHTSQPQRPGINPTEPLWQAQADGGTDILFDADDDFGDFETGPGGEEAPIASQSDASSRQDGYWEAPSVVQTTSLIHEDLLALDGSGSSSSHVTQSVQGPAMAPREAAVENKSHHVDHDATWDDEWGAFEEVQTQTSAPTSSARKHQSQEKVKTRVAKGRRMSDDAEEDWQPFEDGTHPDEVTSASAIDAAEPVGHGRSLVTTAQTGRLSGPLHTTVRQRPTNIPPPSTLLPLLSLVFQELADEAKRPAQRRPELAIQITTVYRVAARIIAGRTLRWKRDTILAQSTRIGPAGKSGGMKLTSINKSEIARDDREVAETVNAWSVYAYIFNAVVGKADVPHHHPRMKMSLSPAMLILTSSNAVSSSQFCALCGLKRSERVSEVDLDLEDIFGEFWTDHWGHKDCSDFWYRYEDRLSRR